MCKNGGGKGVVTCLTRSIKVLFIHVSMKISVCFDFRSLDSFTFLPVTCCVRLKPVALKTVN